jgi:L-serine dehydratase
MFLSVFELFKIGIGPSSSHTVGPMVAARLFLAKATSDDAVRVSVSLHGSLAFTGKGHGTDRACVLGLAGESPDAIEPDHVETVLAEVAARKFITLRNGREVSFDPSTDVIFDYGPALVGHANGMIFTLWNARGESLFSEIYYSIGGGFVQTEAERLESKSQDAAAAKPKLLVPYPFSTAKEMLEMGKASGLTIADMKRANETFLKTNDELNVGIDRIWAAMNACMNRGLSFGGTLPGGLKVKRRASEIY